MDFVHIFIYWVTNNKFVTFYNFDFSLILCYFPQHCLYFFPEPHGHGSFLPIFLLKAEVRQNTDRVEQSTGKVVRNVDVKPVTVKIGPKVGRNDPCPCGSVKKYKLCCGK